MTDAALLVQYRTRLTGWLHPFLLYGGRRCRPACLQTDNPHPTLPSGETLDADFVFFFYALCVSLCSLPVLFTHFGWSYARAQAPAFGTELWHLAGFFMENTPKTGCLGVKPAPRTAILHLILHLKMPGNKGGFHDGCRNVGFFTKTYFGEG